MRRILLVSDTDYRILTRSFLARLLPPRYRCALGSGRPLKEFVTLARVLKTYGFEHASSSNPPALASQEPIEIVKFGPANVDDDLDLIRRYGDRNRSEWNCRNLETIATSNEHIDLGRQTWNLNLHSPQGQATLRRLVAEHGRLFVKSVVKGYAEVVADAEGFLRSFGDLDLADPDSTAVLVSEVLSIQEIDAVVDGRRVRRTDEWRHHVYRGQRVATTHAFECDERRTSDEHRARNVEYADSVAAQLRGAKFATSYVLDTCTLTDSRCTVVEANSFFASGIYTPQAVALIGRAIGEALPR
jgi:hypothetical protein